jgi:hypothetical protein
MHADPQHRGLIGYGEVGRILAEDLRAQGVAVTAYDLKLASPAKRRAAARTRRAARRGAGRLACRPAAGSDWSSAPSPPARPCRWPSRCAPGLAPGAFFLDFNSASPGAKIRAAAFVNAAGGPVCRRRGDDQRPALPHPVPLLLGGSPPRWRLLPTATPGLRRQAGRERLGVASATKMCRSVMIKGLEAMVIESFTTARHYGVEDAVIASCTRPFPASTGRSRPPTSSSGSSNTAAAAAKKCARWPRPCARPASAAQRQRHRRTPGLGGRPGRRRPVRHPRHAGLCPQRRLAHRSRPHPRGNTRNKD